MYVTYTRIYGWSDYGGESSYQPGYRLENMMWMTLLVYDYIIPGEKSMDKLYLENSYAQNPACVACAACALDGPVPDFELALLSGWSEEEE